MYMKINDERFTVYSDDTVGSVIERISSKNKSLPKYILITPENFEIKNGVSLKVDFLEKEIQNVDFFNISTLLKRWEKNNLTLFDLKMLWIYKKDGAKGIPTSNLTPNETRKLIRAYSNFKVVLDEEKKILSKKVKEFEKQRIEFEDIKIPEYTEFTIDKLLKTVKLSTKDTNINLLSIFNNFKTSEVTPFVSLYYEKKRYYKTYESSKINNLWINESMTKQYENTMIVYVKITENKKSIFEPILWSENNEIIYSTKSFENNLDVVDTLLSRVLITKPFKIESQTETSIKGEYKILGVTINRYIFLDMIMNDPYISSSLMVRERNPPRKQKLKIEEVASMKKRFYIYYWPKGIENFDNSFTFTLTETGKGDIDVRIFRIKNIEDVKTFQENFAKIIGVYEKRKETVNSYYRGFIKNYDKKIQSKGAKKVVEKKTKKLLNMLREKRPDLFIKNYSRLCDPKFQPTIVDEEEAKNYDNEEKMKYPEEKGDWYVCKRNDKNNPYIYPGLVRNTKLENKEEEPYLPCCYKESQKNKGGYMEYISGIKNLKRREFGIGHIGGGTKITATYNYSKLPFNIGKLFNKIYGEDVEEKILRFGVPKDQNSFIHCLEEALEPKYSQLSYSKSIKYVENLRKSFINLPLVLAKQEFYGRNIKDIREKILSKDFFDPRLFVNIMAYKYNCNIFLFYFTKRSNKLEIQKKSIDGELLLPFYSSFYLSNFFPLKKSVAIILNPNNQCEIIGDIRKIGSLRHKRFLFTNKNIINYLIQTFNRKMRVYELINDHVTLYEAVKYDFLQDAKAQYIDSMGKVRMIIFGNGINIATAPLPPFNLPSLKKIPVNNAKFSRVNAFIKRYNFRVTSVFKEGVILYREDLPYAFIKTIPPKEIVNVSSYYRSPLEIEDYSIVRNYRVAEKTAHYLLQYTIFMYYQNNKKLSSEDFIIVPDHVYKKFGNEFTFDNFFLNEDKKIIVKDNDMIFRLLYHLKIHLKNFSNDFLYDKNYNIPKLYNSIYDFRKFSGEIIFMSFESLVYYTNNKKIISNEIKENMDMSMEFPYYYKNNNIFGDNIVMIQNVLNGDIESALNVSLLWEYKKYNIGYFSGKLKSSKNISYTLYSEKNVEKIEGTISLDIKIYKYIDGTYAAVMFL